MTCTTTDDRSCETPRRRGALIVLGIMTVLFLALSAFSFLPSRGQVTPAQISWDGHDADAGKRVFQSWNCMGCHTIVGNGAYLGPDLTQTYELAGPAWLAAFLPSAGRWPTEAAVRTHLATPAQQEAAGAATIEAYLERYPGAAERISRRGGTPTHMPNLPFTQEEIGQLIAFLKYTSAMNTEGWPPVVQTGSLERRMQLAGMAPAQPPAEAGAAPASAAPATQAAADPAALGAQLVEDYGCIACHAADTEKRIGPGWGGLAGSRVTLVDGSEVEADAAYLAESIVDPNAKVVSDYPAGVMPPYADLLTADEVEAMVAYLQTLASPETP